MGNFLSIFVFFPARRISEYLFRIEIYFHHISFRGVSTFQEGRFREGKICMRQNRLLIHHASWSPTLRNGFVTFKNTCRVLGLLELFTSRATCSGNLVILPPCVNENRFLDHPIAGQTSTSRYTIALVCSDTFAIGRNILLSIS